eukprot:6491905-Amphidinium_carterae.1
MESVSRHGTSVWRSQPFKSQRAHLLLEQVSIGSMSSSSDTASKSMYFDGMTEHEKLEMFLDQSFVKTTSDVAFHCNQDAMYHAYKFYAPQWAEVIKVHISIHEVSTFNFDTSEGQLVWIYSTVEALKEKLAGVSEENPEIQMGTCYAFPSPVQAVMHMTVHALYQLSDQIVTNSSVALCVEVPHGYLSANGHECKNGYALSHSMTKSELRLLVGAHHGYETMFSMRVLEETGSPSLEVMASLLSGECGTISATMQQHAPKLYGRILALKENRKQTGTTEYGEITETHYNDNGTTKRVKGSYFRLDSELFKHGSQTQGG